MRCATTSLRYCNLRHEEYLLSNHDGWRTDNAGKTTTAHHTRSGKYWDTGGFSIEEKPSYSWTSWLNWWYAPSRWFLRRKNISRREENVRNTLGTHRSTAPYSITKMKWETTWEIKTILFLLKHFTKSKIANFVHFVSRKRLTWRKNNTACKERKSRKR